MGLIKTRNTSWLLTQNSWLILITYMFSHESHDSNPKPKDCSAPGNPGHCLSFRCHAGRGLRHNVQFQRWSEHQNLGQPKALFALFLVLGVCGQKGNDTSGTHFKFLWGWSLPVWKSWLTCRSLVFQITMFLSSARAPQEVLSYLVLR